MLHFELSQSTVALGSLSQNLKSVTGLCSVSVAVECNFFFAVNKHDIKFYEYFPL